MHEATQLVDTREADAALAEVTRALVRRFDLDRYDELLERTLAGERDVSPFFMADLERERYFPGMPDSFSPHMYKRNVDDVQGGLRTTQLESFDVPGAGTVYDKREDTHAFVRAFKARGALFHVLDKLEENPGARTFIAYSSGNHARGLVAAVNMLNVALVESGVVRLNEYGEVFKEDADQLFKAVIYCNEGADEGKVAALREAGAVVDKSFGTLEAAGDAALARAVGDPEGTSFIHPFDTGEVIAGQATLTMELLVDLAAQGVDLRSTPVTLRVAVGGGGMYAGQQAVFERAIAAGLLHPASRIVAVEAHNNDSLNRALLDKTPLTQETLDPLAGGIATLRSGERGTAIVRAYGGSVQVVTQSYMLRAMHLLAGAHNTPPEFAGVLSLASLLQELDDGYAPDPNGIEVTITCGGNASATLLHDTIEDVLARETDLRVVVASEGLRATVFTLMSDRALRVEPYPAPQQVSAYESERERRSSHVAAGVVAFA